MATESTPTGRYLIYFPAQELDKLSDRQLGALHAFCHFTLIGDPFNGVFVSQRILTAEENDDIGRLLGRSNVMHGRRELVLTPSESYPGSYNIRF